MEVLVSVQNHVLMCCAAGVVQHCLLLLFTT